ncbi:MAG: heavy metal translocating P-type ATPase, partial [Oscillospiraceae bacterium]
NSMTVEGSADSAAVIAAVKAAGYGAAVRNGKSEPPQESADTDSGLHIMKLRLFWSLGFLVVLMYISMGATMWGWPLPGFLAQSHAAMGLAQLLLAAPIMVINQKYFVSGFKGLVRRAPNMDTLVALGSAAAFVYSVYALFMMLHAQQLGDSEMLMKYMHELYFESAGMILTLITLGKMLEARSKGKTTDALKSLVKLAPKTACVIRGGEEVTVPVAEVKAGDVFAVRPGESIPADGVVVEGETAVDESALTGESIPVDKIKGDEVSAASINVSGYVRCKALRVGEDTALAQIIKMVSDAAATKAPIAKLADRVSGVFVAAVMAIAAVTAAVWLLAGEGAAFALERAISVLVISCPCALGLATPVAIMVGNGVGAKNGILFKTAASLEQTGKTEIVVLDKTGTITTGQPFVTDILPADGCTEEELLSSAASVEERSEHPLARAVVACGKERGIALREVSRFEALRGSGISAELDGKKFIAGNLRLCETYCDISENERQAADRLAGEGKTPMFFCRDEKLLGIIAVADRIKEESPEAVRQLRGMGIRVVMLTGDNERTAEACAKLVGIDEVIAQVRPADKEEAVRRLRKQGMVTMVGDGINDAPALTRADIGIAIGAGTDVAIDAADVVLMKSRLSDVPAAIRLSRAALRNIRQNLFWAFFYNTVGIPLAAGLWIPLFGIRLSPMFAAAAMSLSSVCVVTNALRLNYIRIFDPKRDKKIKPKKHKEETNMEVTLKIEGMMCGHCEAAVKKALEAIPTVDEAIVSHETGTAVVKLNAETDFSVLKKAVEDKDYKVLD